MTRRLTDAQIERLAYRLQGSCQSLDEAAEFECGISEDEMTVDDCHALDALVFCCERCGWWCEQSEMAEGDEWICDDCSNE